jgi:hypothetical protein
MHRTNAALGLVFLILTLPAVGSPAITSVSPATGPVGGGTAVVIHGSGFNNNCFYCSPPFAEPEVYFGGTPATSAHYVDSGTIEAVTPAHLPGLFSVSVQLHDGVGPDSDTRVDAFTFTGEIEDAFDPILFPIYTGPVRGRYGSEFVTTPRVAAKGTPVPLLGYDTSCSRYDPPIYPDTPYFVGPAMELFPDCSPSVGRLFYVDKGRSADLAAGLRVADTFYDALDHGVEIPVVRRDDFTLSKIVLLGVPIDSRFRNTLRIYGLSHIISIVNVQIGSELRQVSLATSVDPYRPAYVEIADFPATLPNGQQTLTVTVAPVRLGVALPPNPIWAFISVTNNETQRITTITPN